MKLDTFLVILLLVCVLAISGCSPFGYVKESGQFTDNQPADDIPEVRDDVSDVIGIGEGVVLDSCQSDDQCPYFCETETAIKQMFCIDGVCQTTENSRRSCPTGTSCKDVEGKDGKKYATCAPHFSLEFDDSASGRYLKAIESFQESVEQPKIGYTYQVIQDEDFLITLDGPEGTMTVIPAQGDPTKLKDALQADLDRKNEAGTYTLDAEKAADAIINDVSDGAADGKKDGQPIVDSPSIILQLVENAAMDLAWALERARVRAGDQTVPLPSLSSSDLSLPGVSGDITPVISFGEGVRLDRCEPETAQEDCQRLCDGNSVKTYQCINNLCQSPMREECAPDQECKDNPDANGRSYSAECVESDKRAIDVNVNYVPGTYPGRGALQYIFTYADGTRTNIGFKTTIYAEDGTPVTRTPKSNIIQVDCSLNGLVIEIDESSVELYNENDVYVGGKASYAISVDGC